MKGGMRHHILYEVRTPRGAILRSWLNVLFVAASWIPGSKSNRFLEPENQEDVALHMILAQLTPKLGRRHRRVHCFGWISCTYARNVLLTIGYQIRQPVSGGARFIGIGNTSTNQRWRGASVHKLFLWHLSVVISFDECWRAICLR